jgi:hypothetical protein
MFCFVEIRTLDDREHRRRHFCARVIAVMIFLVSVSPGEAQIWQFLGLGDETIDVIAIDRSNPDIIYAGSRWHTEGTYTTAGGVFKSTDGGMTWGKILGDVLSTISI